MERGGLQFGFECLGELVWAGGAIATDNAFEQGNHVLDRTTNNKACDTLGVAWAPAMDCTGGDDAIGDFIAGATCAGATERDGFHSDDLYDGE